MRLIVLETETDFDGWRRAARALALEGVAPDYVEWQVGAQLGGLFAEPAPAGAPTPAAPTPAAPTPAAPEFSVPRAFVELCRSVMLHRDPERFALLYRLLWRLRREPSLLRIAVDADVARAQAMVKAVRRDMHKMKAFVRFRELASEQGLRYIAWFEPTHHVVEATAPFFVRRFTTLHWSILTPEISIHWDGSALQTGPGARREDAPGVDAGEDLWRTYYRSIFNPARLKVAAMQAQMPKKYWRNLPEAELIAPLIAQAPRRTQSMIQSAPTLARKARMQQAGQAMIRPRDALPEGGETEAAAWQNLRTQAHRCRNCPLWAPATQTVFGEGPVNAWLMIVGEQPGDHDDLAGRPFIGPAGQLLEQALEQAGIDRRQTYVTNAVKHFKFEMRGKRRLHKTPGDAEIAACADWLRREIELVQPRVIVALGASAARSMLGHGVPVKDVRGRAIALSERTRLHVSVHPSYLLRLPDDARAEEFRRFVDDLRRAADGEGNGPPDADV